nr:hypothetical protein [Tanacetum cinerariifolium]
PSLDSSLKDNIEKIDSNLEELADEPSLVDLIPSEKYDDLINFKDDDDDLFDLKSDNDEWKKLFTQIFTKVTPDKSLTLEESNILSHSSDHSSDRDLLFFLESTVTENLLSFSSENKGKVFNPGILILKGIHSLTLVLSHQNYEAFKIVNVYLNILNESPMKIFSFFYLFYGGDISSLDVPYLHFYHPWTNQFGGDSS